MKHEKFEDLRLVEHMVKWGRVMGIGKKQFFFNYIVLQQQVGLDISQGLRKPFFKTKRNKSSNHKAEKLIRLQLTRPSCANFIYVRASTRTLKNLTFLDKFKEP